MPTLGVLYSFYTSLTKSLLSLVFARVYKPQHVPTRDLTGQTAIVTGANSGIGLSIAVALASQGATVCLACRNPDRGAAAVDNVVARSGDKSKGRVTCRILDVGDLSSVRSFCQNWTQECTKIDMLVHNAGIAAPPAEISIKTDQGSYSATAHFLHNAARTRNASAPGLFARIIVKGKALLGLKAGSSAAAYGLSKAKQVLFASLLQRRFDAHALGCANDESYRTAHAFTPGFTSTPIFGKFHVTWQTWLTNPLFAILKITEQYVAVDTDEGAKTGVWLATWGDKIGKRRQGGAFWERMEEKTSLVQMMGDRRKTDEWKTWEYDASILWDI